MPDQGSQTHSSGSSDAPSTRVENPAPNHANETQQRPVVVSAPQHAIMAATTPSSSLAGAPGPWQHGTPGFSPNAPGPSYNAPGPSYNAPGPSYNAAGPSYNYFPQPASNVQYSATQYGPPGTSSHNPPSFFGCGPTQAQMTPCNYGGGAPSSATSSPTMLPATRGQSVLPWAMQTGDATVTGPLSGQAAKRAFQEVEAQCGNCFVHKKDLRMLLPCSHMPICIDCLKTASRTQHHLRCFNCRQPVTETISVSKVSPKF